MTSTPSDREHRDHRRYDAYARYHDEHGATELIPAATVIVLRDTPDGLETLMLHKNSKIAFGGMWVFPGGRIDDADEVLDEDGRPDELATAAAAAVREAAEEASVTVDPDKMVWFARWVPPPVMPKRFATFFFAARLEGDAGSVAIDDGEITDHEWMRPADAMARRDTGTIELAPPTWMTLNQLAAYAAGAGALASGCSLAGAPVVALRAPGRTARSGPPPPRAPPPPAAPRSPASSPIRSRAMSRWSPASVARPSTRPRSTVRWRGMRGRRDFWSCRPICGCASACGTRT